MGRDREIEPRIETASAPPRGARHGWFTRVGHLAVRRRRAVLLVSVLIFAAAVLLGLGAADRLSSGGFEATGSESWRAAGVLDQRFAAGNPDLVIVVTAGDGDVDAPAVREAAGRLSDELSAHRGVRDVLSYWSLEGAAPLRSRAGDQALIIARLVGDDDARSDTVAELSARLTGASGVIEVDVGGFQEAFRQTVEQIERDLLRSELIVAPLLLLLLLLVFRSLLAAALPLMVGALAVVGTLATLRVITSLTEVSVFALNLTTALGLGLAIDYSLFVVSRYREELAAGADREAAIVTTVETAGRMVAFSALTVGASLAALLVFPMVFLRSFAFAGVPVVLLAAAGSIVTLPALLAVAGDRLERWAIRRPAEAQPGTGAWHRIAVAVMRRPVPVATAVVALLAVLGAPFLRIELGLPDDRVLPIDAPVRAVHDELRRNFDGVEAFPLLVVAPQAPPRAARAGDVDRYAAALSRLPDVLRVDAETGTYVGGERILRIDELARRFSRPDGTYLSVVPTVEPISAAAEHLVERLRRTPAPFAVEVSGRSAQLVDTRDVLLDRLPTALTLIAVATFVLLFLAFGSVLVPVKAVVLNLLSLTATFGAMVWMFQEGHLATWLQFTPTGTLDMATPILMFAIAFGMSMDYEVFLLSRIREEYDRTGNNTAAVAAGLERTGRLITAAAVLMAVVLVVIGTSGVSIIKLFGLGLALAIVVDASLVRAALVPAVMQLAGRANWWAPAWLRTLHARVGMHRGMSAAEAAPAPAPGGAT